ncbi:MAG TPA: outer membrane protein transport protein [Gemmatimonadaceae bacterium]|nr:outer membrane protein transport protein [Gemmatimonadaceae bacterium]
MTLHRASRYTLALALLALPAAAGAQAFGLNEIGSCALARGFAATAMPCDDGSSIYWNPGAMPRTRGWSVAGGAAVIHINGDFIQDTTFTRHDSDVPTAVVPHLFVNYRGAGKLAYGLGVYVPYGLTSQWADDFPGRFAAKKASLQTLYVQPNISYQITPNWSIGGGPVFGHSTVELIQGVDLSQQRTSATGPTFGQLGIPLRTEFARANLKGSATAFGVDLGVHGKLTPAWDLGLRFLSQLSFDYTDADATFEARNTGLVLAANNPFGVPAGTPVDALVASQFTTGALVPQKVSTQIRHPAQVQVGFAYSGFQNTTLSAEYSYVGWKSFNQLPVDFQGGATDRVLQEDYNNTSGIRLGAEHRLVSGLALRAGFTANTAAAPDETVTPLLPEQDRSLAGLGIGYPFGGRYVLDASYARVMTPGRRGRIDERAPGSSATQAIALNSGSYILTANILALTLKASF